MIYELSHPTLLLVSVASILLAWFVHVGAQRLAVRLMPRAGLRWLLRPGPWLARVVDPYGAVAALLGGVGWAPPLEWESARRGRRGPVIVLLLSGAVANLVVGVAALIGLGKLAVIGASVMGSTALRATVGGYLVEFLYIFGGLNVVVGLLSLVPLPPLEGGRLMFLLAPRTLGWQKAEYQLVERNIGLVALLLLLIVPLRGNVPVLQYVLGVIAGPIERVALSVFG